MKTSRFSLALPAIFLSGAALFAFCQTPQKKISVVPKAASVAAQRVLIVGGGPNLNNNQVAIESNVRYLNRILPPTTSRTVLFADGKTQSENVFFDQPQNLSRGEYLYDLIWEDDGPQSIVSTWRRPNLGWRLEGASRRADIDRAFGNLARDSRKNPRPVLLYFTGHGSQNQANSNDNFYDLWNGEQLSVRDLAAQIARLPRKIPVTIVMVQCFSGAFANLLFAEGKPQNRVLERDIAGFFAATRTRVAAGCTSEVDEAEYHDFTSYFFAALSGRDRVGRKISGVDFNRDGRVGGDEAFCYTLAEDKSIDVPVATSDIFLRRFVSRNNSSTRYSHVLNRASSGQKYALEKLSKELGLSGENRLAQARQKLEDDSSLPQIAANLVSESAIARDKSRFESLRHNERARLLKIWPNLKSANKSLREAAQTALTAQLEREANDANWKNLRQAANEWQKLELEKARVEEAAEVRRAHLLRFVSLHESVALGTKLMNSNNNALKNRFARLLRHEAQTFLPSVK